MDGIGNFNNNEFLGGCENCGYGTKELIAKSEACPFCGHKPKIMLFKISKRETEVNMGDKQPAPGQSERDFIWHDEILPAFDIFQQNYAKEQHQNRLAAGLSNSGPESGYKSLSREQLLSKFFETKEGKHLYEKYQSANPDVTPQVITKGDEEPRNLREYADRALEGIAKRYQQPDQSIERAHWEASKRIKEYAQIYCCGYDNILGTIDFSNKISKSKSDAISLWKNEINRLAREAGV